MGIVPIRVITHGISLHQPDGDDTRFFHPTLLQVHPAVCDPDALGGMEAMSTSPSHLAALADILHIGPAHVVESDTGKPVYIFSVLISSHPKLTYNILYAARC